MSAESRRAGQIRALQRARDRYDRARATERKWRERARRAWGLLHERELRLRK